MVRVDLDQLPKPIEQPILDEIDRLNHNVDLDAVRTDCDRRVRSLGSARVAGIDLAIRTVERTAGVEIDRPNHNVDDLDTVRTDRDRRARSLGSARVAGIDVVIRTVDRIAGVEIDHGNEIDYGYGIEP